MQRYGCFVLLMLELLVFNKELCCEVYIYKHNRDFFIIHEIGLAALTLIARRFENSANKKKTRKPGFFILYERGLAALILIARRFENSANKKKRSSEASL